MKYAILFAFLCGSPSSSYAMDFNYGSEIRPGVFRGTSTYDFPSIVYGEHSFGEASLHLTFGIPQHVGHADACADAMSAAEDVAMSWCTEKFVDCQVIRRIGPTPLHTSCDATVLVRGRE